MSKAYDVKKQFTQIVDIDSLDSIVINEQFLVLVGEKNL